MPSCRYALDLGAPLLQVSRIEAEIRRLRKESLEQTKTAPSAFVLFKDQYSASVAAQSVLHAEVRRMEADTPSLPPPAPPSSLLPSLVSLPFSFLPLPCHLFPAPSSTAHRLGGERCSSGLPSSSSSAGCILPVLLSLLPRLSERLSSTCLLGGGGASADAPLRFQDSTFFSTEPSPGPDDINWRSLWYKARDKNVRRLIAFPFVAFIIILPAGFFTGQELSPLRFWGRTTHARPMK